MTLTGKIKTLIHKQDGSSSFGYIIPDVPIENWQNDLCFWDDNITNGIDFSDLSKGDLVEFILEEWSKRDSSIEMVAKQIKVISKNQSINQRISGIVRYLKKDDGNFYGFITPHKSFLGHTNNIIFFRDCVSNNTLNKLVRGSKVDFVLENWDNKQNPNINKVAKQIKLINNKSENKLIDLMGEIKTVSDPFRFEDLVFILLRLIGITNIYQCDRNNCAGEPDGLFVYGKFAVVYDCTLRNPFQPYKDKQIFNYKSQLKEHSSITIQLKRIDGKSKQINVPLPNKREVWIITRGKTRLIEKDNGIDVREISINTLFDMLEKNLSVKFSGQLNK